MKKWIKIFFIIYNIVIPAHFSLAQNSHLEQINKIYQQSNSAENAKLRFELATDFFDQQNYSASLHELNKIPLYLVNYELLNQILYYQGILLFFNQEYTESLQKLAQVKQLDSIQNQTVHLTKIICLNHLHLFDSATLESKNYILYYTKNLHTKDSLIKLVGKLYLKKPRIKSERIAKNLALIIPGSGIIYGGKPLEGVFSFSIQAASLSFAIFEFLNHNYLTGYVLGLAMLQKFYFGSQKRTNEVIMTKNTEKINTFNAELVLILKSIDKNKL
jgi:hypothetical protein